MAIYVKIKRKKYLKDFLKLLYSHPQTGYLTCVESYRDKDCTILQCKSGKYRSFEEILEIVNTYYPSITIQKLCKVLFNLKLKYQESDYYFYYLNCNKVKKTTTLFAIFKCNSDSNQHYSKWTINELIKMSKN